MRFIQTLKCPAGFDDYLHQQQVIVRTRTLEDGDGLEATVSGGDWSDKTQSVTLRPVESDAMPGRRQSVDIVFACEHCRGGHTLRLLQRKGNTTLEWLGTEAAVELNG